MQQIWVESRHRITFDGSWRVRAYDRSPWFRHVHGLGLKGVDFLALREGRLYLVELKNYAPEPGRPAPLLPAADRWLEDMEAKFADSLRMAGIVMATLRRHLLFRCWEWGALRLAILRRMEPEWTFWMDVEAAIAAHRQIPVVWIIDGPDPSRNAAPGHWAMLRGKGPFEALPGLTASPK
jgi:hypothetical protein